MGHLVYCRHKIRSMSCLTILISAKLLRVPTDLVAPGERANPEYKQAQVLKGLHTRTESRLYINWNGKTMSFSAMVGIMIRSDAIQETD